MHNAGLQRGWAGRLRIGMLLVIAASPWPWGAVETHWTLFWTATLALLVASAPLHLSKGQGRALASIFCLAAAFATVVLLQQNLHVAASWIWSSAARELGTGPGVTGSSRAVPLVDFALPVLAVFSFTGGFLGGGADRRSAEGFLLLVALAGAATACVVILRSDVVGASFAPGGEVGVLSGPFVNRNHAATYYGSCATIALALLLGRIRRSMRAAQDPVSGFAELVGRPPMRAVAAGTAFVICAVATFLTQSRAGILAMLLAQSVVFGCVLMRSMRARRAHFIVAGAVVLGLALLIELAGARVALRFATEGLVDQGRAQAYRGALAIIGQRPLLGAGLGSFADVFMAYRDPAVSTIGLWDHAHNSWLELAVEMGLPFSAAILVLSAVILAMLLRGIFDRQRPFEPSLVGCLGVMILAGTHAVFDFSLQIPACLIFVLAVTGFGWSHALRGHRTAPASAGHESATIFNLPRRELSTPANQIE